MTHRYPIPIPTVALWPNLSLDTSDSEERAEAEAWAEHFIREWLLTIPDEHLAPVVISLLTGNGPVCPVEPREATDKGTGTPKPADGHTDAVICQDCGEPITKNQGATKMPGHRWRHVVLDCPSTRNDWRQPTETRTYDQPARYTEDA